MSGETHFLAGVPPNWRSERRTETFSVSCEGVKECRNKDGRRDRALTANQVGQRRVQVAGQHFPRVQRGPGTVNLRGWGWL